MNATRTQVHRQSGRIRPVSGFRSALSLHSHTHHSKERLEFLPRYLNYHKIPLITSLAKRRFESYRERTGKPIDFSRAYWTPPLPASQVVASEKDQIENNLNLAAFVSITDHDSIAGPLELRSAANAAAVPISVEWTIPFEGNAFHVGVHHLPPARAVEIMDRLARYTAEASVRAALRLVGDAVCLPRDVDHSESSVLQFRQSPGRAALAESSRLSSTLPIMDPCCRDQWNAAVERKPQAAATGGGIRAWHSEAATRSP